MFHSAFVDLLYTVPIMPEHLGPQGKPYGRKLSSALTKRLQLAVLRSALKCRCHLGESGAREKGLTGKMEKGGIVDNVGGHCSTADFLHREKGSECWEAQVNRGKGSCLDMSFPLEEERYQLTTVQRRGNVIQGENNEEAYDWKKQFKAGRRAVLLRLAGDLKPVRGSP
eukprot:g28376.t1